MAAKQPTLSLPASQPRPYPCEYPGAHAPEPDWPRLGTVSTCSELLQGSASSTQWQSLRIAGSAQALRLSHSSVDFLLAKLTETAIPVTLLLPSSESCHAYSGTINKLECLGNGLRVHFSQCHQPCCIADFCDAWLVFRPCAIGGITTLELFDDCLQPIASIAGQRHQCIAWRALTQWLTLRESPVSGRWTYLSQTQGQTHAAH